MRHILLSFFLLFAVHTVVDAQDFITKRTGEKIQTKVLEITTNEIKYKNFNNLEGPTYVLAKSEVLLIQYENNTNEVFEITNPTPASTKEVAKANAVAASIPTSPAITSETAMQHYHRGQADALTFYEGYKAAGTGVLIVSLISPLVGIVPAIGTSATPPKKHNLDAPNSQLLINSDYAAGYTKSARKIKARKVWMNWGIGLGVNMIAAALIMNGQ